LTQGLTGINAVGNLAGGSVSTTSQFRLNLLRPARSPCRRIENEEKKQWKSPPTRMELLLKHHYPWRLKNRMKHNGGTDPLDITKPHPCAKLVQR
jgi:hypothetical protein